MSHLHSTGSRAAAPPLSVPAPKRRPLARALAHALPGVMLLSAGLLLSPAALADTYTVVNTSDSGTGSLRAAIDQANANPGSDTITFDSSVTGNINLTTAPLYIYDSLDLQGPGASVLTVNGSNILVAPLAQNGNTQGASSSGSVFLIAPGSMASVNALVSGHTTGGGPPPAMDVTISGLTVTGGNNKYGGGIASVATHLNVLDCVVTGNTAESMGGGIAALTKYGSLNVADSVISNNTVTGDSSNGGPPPMGGGISLYEQSATISRSTISGNAAAFGGGVSTVAQGGNGSGPQGTAGAPAVVADLTITDSTLSDNHAVGTSMPPPNTINLGNAMTGGGPTSPSGIGGGAVSSAVNVLISNSTVSGNSASNLGGGLALASVYGATSMIANSTIVGNSTNGYGGGLVIQQYYSPNPGMSNSIIAGNTAPSEADVSTDGPPGSGLDLSFSLVQVPGAASLNDGGGNIFNQAPMLGVLTNNGGPTLTRLPLAGSPLIDAGDPAFSGPGNDQRGPGYGRIFNGRVDIGATEYGAGATTGTAAYTAVPDLGHAGKLGLGALLGLIGAAWTRRRRKLEPSSK